MKSAQFLKYTLRLIKVFLVLITVFVLIKGTQYKYYERVLISKLAVTIDYSCYRFLYHPFWNRLP